MKFYKVYNASVMKSNTKDKISDINDRIKEKISATPLGVNGVAVGTMGIANTGTFLLDLLYKQLNLNYFNIRYVQLTLQIICISICIFYISLTCLRYIMNKKQIWEELKIPHVAGMVGVLFLSLCILGNSFGWIYANFITDAKTRYILLIGPNILVFTTTLCQICYMILFIKIVLIKKEVMRGEAFASWFVPLIGLGLSTAYANDLGDLIPLYYWQIIWFVAFGMFLVMYPFVFYKFLFKPHSRESDIPSMAIFASPANMLASGFLVSFSPHRGDLTVIPQIIGKSHHLTMTLFNNDAFFQVVTIILFCYGAVSVALYYSILIKSLKLWKYNLSWTSLTFPASISASGTIHFALFYFNEARFDAIRITLITIGLVLFTTSLILTIFVNVKYGKIMYNIWIKNELKPTPKKLQPAK
ncbi:hypothetical protein ACNQ2A_00090 [Mycoplasma sp. 1458C]|uniref:SLAC1 family transporter n=1 Tax=Mycoplasma sp. 1458C TaxID=3401661 RepID=UPI003AADB943